MLLAFSKSNDSPCFVKIAIFRQKEKHPIRGAFSFANGEIRMCIEHAGGMFMSQCAHWRIPLSDFPVPRKGKSDASESLHLCQTRTAFLTKIATAALSGFPVPRQGKTDASESLHLRRKRIRIATPVRALACNNRFEGYHIVLPCPGKGVFCCLPSVAMV